MKRQKKSHKSPKLKTEEERKLHELSGFGHYEVISPLPLFGGRAVIEIPSPKMNLMYSGGDMVEQFKKNGMNVEEILIPKENPLEDVDNTPLDEYIDVMHHIWIEYLLWQAKHILERSNREEIHREEE